MAAYLASNPMAASEQDRFLFLSLTGSELGVFLSRHDIPFFAWRGFRYKKKGWRWDGGGGAKSRQGVRHGSQLASHTLSRFSFFSDQSL